ncbi:hypothetical protein HKBW3S03_00467 [Candidatus Hakubella thermalkaliphila]|uniref:Uncharacterized protein n=1 Tax=Candidatus Hakubella thermalkaliphila TaxID=2754717 RepID=A0A6V8QCS5_9ACTN|nr:hypothetical protein HKBW3S03_00467 [Candidatus Hakubella thermalkaliphila]GFP29465.1 hypothetical protein HKBW3S34_00385 [Candidatus Hakubella thermalkaliphila]GFP41126.1 hypothetical protein HKBW3C_00252 [Candidatus Hakubella thermalkaliphila]
MGFAPKAGAVWCDRGQNAAKVVRCAHKILQRGIRCIAQLSFYLFVLVQLLKSIIQIIHPNAKVFLCFRLLCILWILQWF